MVSSSSWKKVNPSVTTPQKTEGKKEDNQIVNSKVTSTYGNPVKLNKTTLTKFETVVDNLLAQNINLQVADSYRDYNNQEKAYKSGKKGVAPPDKSFHVKGQAFDLAQTEEMKNPTVFAELKKQGFRQHPNEWWHWSLGEFTEPEKPVESSSSVKSIKLKFDNTFKTAAVRNNNPGNLEFAGQAGATKNGRWAKFNTPEEGFKALQNQIILDAKPERKHTLKSFIKKYAPQKENDTTKYISNIIKLAKSSNINENTALSIVLDKVGKKELAKIISNIEDINMYEKVKNF